jgi:hypothetical protein
MVPVDHSDGSPRKIMCTSIGLLYEWYVRVSSHPFLPAQHRHHRRHLALSPFYPRSLDQYPLDRSLCRSGHGAILSPSLVHHVALRSAWCAVG